jgi:hypothetical protein
MRLGLAAQDRPDIGGKGDKGQEQRDAAQPFFGKKLSMPNGASIIPNNRPIKGRWFGSSFSTDLLNLLISVKRLVDRISPTIWSTHDHHHQNRRPD